MSRKHFFFPFGIGNAGQDFVCFDAPALKKLIKLFVEHTLAPHETLFLIKNLITHFN